MTTPPTDATARPDAEIFILINAGSGGERGREAVDRIESAFGALSTAVEIRVLETGDEIEAAVAEARARGFGTIIAAGGDGTICAVASALRGTDATMGIIPLGTFNYFARSVGAPADEAGAVQAIADGFVTPMRIATINGEVFLNNTSLGAYSAILETREDIYKRWGRSRVAAYWSVIKTLATLRRSLRLEVEIEGRTRRFRTPLAFAVNNAFQIEQMGLEGREEIAAGRLVLLIAPHTSRWRMVWHAATLAIGLARPKRDYEMLSGQTIIIRSRRSSHKVARDGERSRMSAPFTLEVELDALSLIVPRGFDDAAPR